MLAGHFPTRTIGARLIDSLATVDHHHWNNMFPGKGEDWHYLVNLERVPPPGFKLGAIVIERDGELIAGAPVFRTTYRFDTSIQGRLRQVGDRLHRLSPRLTSMRVLSLGSPLAHACHIGFSPGISHEERREAAGRMLTCLEQAARREGAQLIAANGLSSEEADDLKAVFAASGYARVTTIPNVVLDLPYRSVEGYLASLPDSTARYLKRKWRSAAQVRIEYRQSLDDVRDEINALYSSTLSQSRWNYGNFGPVHPEYFGSVLTARPDNARVMLCWAGDRLLSFQLFVSGRDAALAKGIGMRYPEARERNCYFLNWKEMIEHCVATGIPRISMAGTTYATKLMMGGRLERKWIFFRFANPLLNRSLPWLAPLFDFESNDPELKSLAVGADGKLDRAAAAGAA